VARVSVTGTLDEGGLVTENGVDRRRRRGATVIALLATLVPALWFPSGTMASAAAVVPAGFDDSLVAKVGRPTAMAFTPDGRILVTSKYGRLFVIQDGALVSTPAIDLSARICDDGERGLLGVAVDPAFDSNHYVYLYYTFKKFGSCPVEATGTPVNRVSRFVLRDSNVIKPISERILIDNIPNYGGIHDAGDLEFGKDGNLYVSVGDGGCDYALDSDCDSRNDAARDQNVLLGKILRITPAGGIPPHNPYTGIGSARCNLTGMTDPGTTCRETFSWGLRNPWRIAFDPNATHSRFFIDDVGQGTWEEIDKGHKGADYGWNVREGPCSVGSRTNCGPPPAGMTNPIWSYDHSTGCTAVTGGAFVPNGIWPAAFDNTYLYGDFICGKIVRLTPAMGGGFTASDFVTGLGTSSITTLKFGPYGSSQAAYYLNNLNGGEVRRVAYVG
jgi:glucose/arabinose dehydrogenase